MTYLDIFHACNIKWRVLQYAMDTPKLIDSVPSFVIDKISKYRWFYNVSPASNAAL